MVSSLAITGVLEVRANGVKRAPRRGATAFGMAVVPPFIRLVGAIRGKDEDKLSQENS